MTFDGTLLALTTARREGGFSLFEVLITVVVISIGLLGLAALQFAGMRAANNAYEHTLANLLAQDIEERIRANPNGNYSGTSLAWNGSAPTITTNCNTASCSITQMRSFDRWEWYYAIHNESGHNVPVLSRATIAISSPIANSYVITITWGDNPPLTSNFSL